MQDLIQSIKEKGVLTPPIVRTRPEGGYEVISGHRRKHAASLAGLFKIPVVVRDLSDEDAVDVMVYSNIQRTNVLPSEKAFAYRMQWDLLRHPGKKGRPAPEEVGRKYGDNARKVQRYVRLTYLLPELLDYIDSSKLTMQAGYAISFLSKEEQGWVQSAIKTYQKMPNGKCAEQIRSKSEDKVLTEDMVKLLILGKPRRKRNITLKGSSLDKYFPPEMSGEEIEKTVYMLLDQWKEGQGK
jgi:ParB family chromosome partitioning protein